MTTFTSHSNRFKLTTRPYKVTPSIDPCHYQLDTVNCETCHRFMVPRMINYYGQPYRSICPFCAATYRRFPSSFQRFIERFQTPSLSFGAFIRLSLMALCFGFLWLINSWVFLPEELTLITALATSLLTALALAELIAQSIEHIAAKFYHQSVYYWGLLITLALYLANAHTQLTRYIVIFFIIMGVRWLFAGLAQGFNNSIN
ncbi:MAG: hypothetical protein RLZZ419_1340 [Pseudomonadota bacterium]|jgi:hypothetical protein